MRRCAGVRALLRRNGLGAAPRRLRGGGDAAATRFRRGGKRGLLAIALPGWEGRTGRAVSACVAASVCDAQGVELRCASAQERAALQTIMEDKIKAHTRTHAPTLPRTVGNSGRSCQSRLLPGLCALVRYCRRRMRGVVRLAVQGLVSYGPGTGAAGQSSRGAVPRPQSALLLRAAWLDVAC